MRLEMTTFHKVVTEESSAVLYNSDMQCSIKITPFVGAVNSLQYSSLTHE